MPKENESEEEDDVPVVGTIADTFERRKHGSADLVRLVYDGIFIMRGG